MIISAQKTLTFFDLRIKSRSFSLKRALYFIRVRQSGFYLFLSSNASQFDSFIIFAESLAITVLQNRAYSSALLHILSMLLNQSGYGSVVSVILRKKIEKPLILRSAIFLLLIRNCALYDLACTFISL